MPTFKKVSVDIITPQGCLPALHQETCLTDSLCESYIQSKTDCEFWISITPETVKSERARGLDLCAPVVDPTGDTVEEKEWHLLAEVFLDDIPVAETTCIVYLPWDGNVKKRTIKGRITTDANGRCVEKVWYFKELGLENFLQILAIDKDATEFGETSNTPDDSLAESMNRLDTKGKEKHEARKVGQIRVVLNKITITGLFVDLDYAPNSVEKYEKGRGKSAGEASHTADVGKGIGIKFSDTRKIYRLEESKPYATFVFNYRGEKELRKMGLLDRPQPYKKLDKLVPFLTPLAISGSYKKPEKSKSLGRSGPVSSSEDEAPCRRITSDSVKGSPKRLLPMPASESGRSGTEGSSDQQDKFALAIVKTLALEDATHEADISTPGDALTLFNKSARSLTRINEPNSPLNDGYDGDTETLRITEHGEQDTLEEMEELSARLELVKLKRSHSGEQNDSEGEVQVAQGERHIKRIKWHAPDPELVMEEVMSEAKESEITSKTETEITTGTEEVEVEDGNS